MNKSQQSKQNWSLIIKDMLILMLFVCGVGVVCKLGMAAFERDSPGEDLVSIVNKNKMDDQGSNPDFLAEIERGKQRKSDFINSIDGNGITPLMWICYANFNNADEDAIKDQERYYYVNHLLRIPNIKLHATDNTGMTALHWAAWSGLYRCAALLIEKGADIHARDSKGYTPLMLAAMRGNVSLVKMLLALGAKTHEVNHSGMTALQLAEKHETAYQSRHHWAFALIYHESRDKGHQDCVALLKKPLGIAPQNIASIIAPIREQQSGYQQKNIEKRREIQDSDSQSESQDGSKDKYHGLWKIVFLLLILPLIPLAIFLFSRKSPSHAEQ